MPENTELLIGLGLFALSEAIGLSRAKENTVLQVVLKIAMRAFPYEIRRRAPDETIYTFKPEPERRRGPFGGRDDRRKDHRLKRDR